MHPPFRGPSAAKYSHLEVPIIGVGQYRCIVDVGIVSHQFLDLFRSGRQLEIFCHAIFGVLHLGLSRNACVLIDGTVDEMTRMVRRSG